MSRKYCNCMDKLSVKDGLRMIIDEVVELVTDPSLDELSDVSFTINRFIGNRVNRDFVLMLPGSGRYLRKIEKRMQRRGCIRSERHITSCEQSDD